MSSTSSTSTYFSKESLHDKINQNRERIRGQQHKRMLENRRKEILHAMFPLKSKTFGAFLDKPARQLIFLGDALNNQLRNENTAELDEEDQRDLIDDLSYLLFEANFRLEVPLRLNKNGDRYVCEFICTYFGVLPPKEVDAWLDVMTVDHRKELYTLMDCSTHQQYMTTKLLACLLQDFAELEAVELMCEFVNKGEQVHRLVSMKLVEKLLIMLQQSTVSLSYTHLGVGIYLRFSNEAFAIFLLDRLFMHISQATPLQNIERYVVYINHIQQAKPTASLRTSFCSAINRIESIVTQEQLQQIAPFMHNRHVLKMLIQCIENHRKQAKQYELQPSTIFLLGKQSPNNDTRQLAEKLCSRVHLPPPRLN